MPDNPFSPAVIGRFAPTPSGRLHLGNLFCALLAWASAKSQGGKIILRIEDLDLERSPRAFADQLETDLQWLGLDFDEGGRTGGAHQPYYQSERFDIYQKFFHQLRQKAEVYPCFCSRASLHAASAPHLSDGRVLYPGTCYGLSPEAIRERQKRRPPASRVHLPDRVISFVDGIQGEVSASLPADCGDFVVRRADGVYAYQFAVVVDDGMMGVTQVVRGRDLLESTPVQIWLFETLGFSVPEFYHIPLLLDSEGRRLSKRDADLDLSALRKRFLPEDIVGLLAFLAGQVPKWEQMTPKELAKIFRWERVPKQDICLPKDFEGKA